MTRPIIPHNSSTGANWQVIGELKLDPAPPSPILPVGWLHKTLQPLGLPAPLLENLNQSANQALGRLHQEVPPIRLRICIPGILPPDAANWGYFYMQKNDSVEFYLYPEG